MNCDRGYNPCCTKCETSYCGNYGHTPNLGISHSRCTHCMRVEVTRESKCIQCGSRCSTCETLGTPCDTCGFREFSGPETAKDFCIWLFGCSQLMRLMMYRWWCEGGCDKAWWVLESVFLRSPDKGFWACLGDSPTDMPRLPETWVLLCSLMVKLCGISHSSAILVSDSPQSSNSSGLLTLFIPSETHNVYPSIAVVSRLPRPTLVPALTRELHSHHCRPEEPG